MKNKKGFTKTIFTAVSPMLAYFSLYGVSFAAATCTLPSNGNGVTLKVLILDLIIGCILANTAYLIVAAAIVVFVYGIFKFISSDGDDKQGGRELMFWGIVGIFVMVSFWGLASILQNTFNF